MSDQSGRGLSSEVRTEWGLLHDCADYGCAHGDSGIVRSTGRERPTHPTINGHPAVIVSRTITYSAWEADRG